MHVESTDGILELSFDRPGVRNAISKAVAEQLVEQVTDATPDEYDAIVITGEGEAFSAGGDLEERVTETVERLARRPTDVLGMTKQVLHENMGRPWDDALEYETLLQVQARHTDAHEEGVTAFIEGRQPEFDV